MFVTRTPMASMRSPQSPGASTVANSTAMALLQQVATVVDVVLEVDVDDDVVGWSVLEVDVVGAGAVLLVVELVDVVGVGAVVLEVVGVATVVLDVVGVATVVLEVVGVA